jgi:hypothetical protein
MDEKNDSATALSCGVPGFEFEVIGPLFIFIQPFVIAFRCCPNTVKPHLMHKLGHHLVADGMMSAHEDCPDFHWSE